MDLASNQGQDGDHAGALDGDQGARKTISYHIMHMVLIPVFTSYCVLVFRYSTVANKIIPIEFQRSVFPLCVHHQESSSV